MRISLAHVNACAYKKIKNKKLGSIFKGKMIAK